jgi:hypothetical protein
MDLVSSGNTVTGNTGRQAIVSFNRLQMTLKPGNAVPMAILAQLIDLDR